MDNLVWATACAVQTNSLRDKIVGSVKNMDVQSLVDLASQIYSTRYMPSEVTELKRLYGEKHDY